jgi:hypothetical protein
MMFYLLLFSNSLAPLYHPKPEMRRSFVNNGPENDEKNEHKELIF